jgi:ribosomal protein L37E
MYIDSKTNMNLYDLHRFSKKKIEKPRYVRNISLPDILEGKYPDYKPQVLKRRLIREGYKKEECSLCGFSERRVTDYTVPLVVAWRDGNRLNFSEDNLELICYNCYYLAYGNIKSRSEKPVFEAAY